MEKDKNKIKCSELLVLLKMLQESLDKSAKPLHPEPWMAKEEVMLFLRISASTYYKWRKMGILVPSSRLGEDRYLLSDIQKIINEKERRVRLKSTDKI